MDTNILSTFAKVGRMALLLRLLDGFNVAISANVFSEVRKAHDKTW